MNRLSFVCLLFLAGITLSGCSSISGGFPDVGLKSIFDRSPTHSTHAELQSGVSLAPLAAGRNRLSSANTRIEFTGSAGPMKKTVHFKNVSGSFISPSANQPGSIEIMIDMESLETGNWLLTKHLKSKDFFDVKQHASSRFVSTSIQPTQRPNQYTVVGQITIHGVTRRIEAPAIIKANPSGMQLSMDFTVKQTDFGMKNGARKTGNEVPVSVRAGRPVL